MESMPQFVSDVGAELFLLDSKDSLYYGFITQ